MDLLNISVTCLINLCSSASSSSLSSNEVVDIVDADEFCEMEEELEGTNKSCSFFTTSNTCG